MASSALVGSVCASTAQTQKQSPDETLTIATKWIQHALGTADVPVKPTRIVVVGYFTVEVMMALGVQSIADIGVPKQAQVLTQLRLTRRAYNAIYSH